jgi:two-component system response regulator
MISTQTKMTVNPVSLLIADDDPDDRMLMKDALHENGISNEIYFVEDGSQLMDYLYRRGPYNERNAFRPGLILLDLNMPKIDGRQALKLIKSDTDLRRIPVIALTTSRAEEDIANMYDLGVNSVICKPGPFSELVKIACEIRNYWLNVVALPGT